MAFDSIDHSLRSLLAGVLRFQREVYPRQQTAYRGSWLDAVNPHTLFITCCDSGIDPEVMTQSGPGEILVYQNLGNLVPVYRKRFDSISSIIEHAGAALQVSQIVVCGHSDCCAMGGLLQPERLARVPTVRSWLRHAEPALRMVRASCPSSEEPVLLSELIEKNAVLQMRNLRTYPSVSRRLAEGSLAICAWVYDTGHGMVRIFDQDQHRFLPVTGDSSGAPAADATVPQSRDILVMGAASNSSDGSRS